MGGELWGVRSLWFSSDGETFVRKAVPTLYTWVLRGILPTRDGELLAETRFHEAGGYRLILLVVIYRFKFLK